MRPTHVAGRFYLLILRNIDAILNVWPGIKVFCIRRIGKESIVNGIIHAGDIVTVAPRRNKVLD